MIIQRALGTKTTKPINKSPHRQKSIISDRISVNFMPTLCKRSQKQAERYNQNYIGSFTQINQSFTVKSRWAKRGMCVKYV